MLIPSYQHRYWYTPRRALEDGVVRISLCDCDGPLIFQGDVR